MDAFFKNDLKTGIFVAIGLLAIMVSIIVLGGDQFLFRSTSTLRARFPQVQGLAKGSIVSLAGVPVGNINKLYFVEGVTDIEIEMDINRDHFTRITTGSLASVKTQGALGDKYIYITPGAPEAEVLKSGALIATDQQKDLIDIIAARGAELGNVIEVVKEARDLLRSINEGGKSAQVMTNMLNATNNMNKMLSDVRSETLPKMNRILTKIDEGQGTLGQLINDPSLHKKMKSFVGGEAAEGNYLSPLIRDSMKKMEKNRSK